MKTHRVYCELGICVVLIKQVAGIKLKKAFVVEHWPECLTMIYCRGFHKNWNGQTFSSIPGVFMGLESSPENEIERQAGKSTHDSLLEIQSHFAGGSLQAWMEKDSDPRKDKSFTKWPSGGD